LGTEVTPAFSRREVSDPDSRMNALVNQLASSGGLTGGLRIPGAVGVLHVTADLRAGQIICHVDADAPREGRSTARVNWLVRQLRNAPEDIRIEAFTMYARGTGTAELLHRVRENPMILITDPTKDLRSFRVAQTSAAGTKRGTGRGAFIDSVLAAVDSFYEQVIQTLRPWVAPPKMRTPEDTAPVEPVSPTLISTAPSSQDSPDDFEPPDADHDDTEFHPPGPDSDRGHQDPLPREDIPSTADD